MICIYCKRDLPPEGFSTEHVIPRAFDTFKQNFTLNDLVCSDCNQYFGDTIDFILARGSAEGLQRLEYSVQPSHKARELRRDRVRFAWVGGGRLNGLILELVADPSGLVVQPVPQVGFAGETDERLVFVSEEVLQDLTEPLPSGINLQQFVIVSNSGEAEQRIIETLKTRNIKFRSHGSWLLPITPGQLLPVEVTSTVDALVLRCIVKIAFSYLACTQSRELVLRDEFSAARGYVRYGVRCPYPLVIVDSEPILREDTAQIRQTNGHLVTVGWARDGRSICAQLSLFNHARYRVNLARGFRGVWREIRSGHHFDLESRELSALLPSSLILV